MVPGSTFRYGSNFCSVTFSPRLSSRHPIDAAAIPFPSEETTPPVTKIYLAISFCALQGRFEQPGHAFEIGRRIHSQRLVLGFHHADAMPVFKRTQLLETLRLLQRSNRQGGVAEQKIPLIHVEADMFEEDAGAIARRRARAESVTARNRAPSQPDRPPPSPRSDR